MYERQFHNHHLIPSIVAMRWPGTIGIRYDPQSIVKVPEEQHLILQRRADILVKQAIEKENTMELKGKEVTDWLIPKLLALK